MKRYRSRKSKTSRFVKLTHTALKTKAGVGKAPQSSQLTLSENCLLLGTDTVCGQTIEHMSVLNGGHCLDDF